MKSDAPETVGDLPSGTTVRYFGEKHRIHIDAVDCPQTAGTTAGNTREADVLFDNRPICQDCRDRYRDEGST